jgi:hypothetical protein
MMSCSWYSHTHTHTQFVCGDVGIYVLCKAGAFADHPPILRYWCKVFFHNGRRGLEKMESTLDELTSFQARTDELHAEHEYRFPLRSLTSARHYDTHDPLCFKLAGNRKVFFCFVFVLFFLFPSLVPILYNYYNHLGPQHELPRKGRF